jgi:ATP-dependent RNA helicase DDX18/HAS1
LSKNYFLQQSAKDGFRSYLQSYASYSLKKVFDINALDLAKVGKAFGFSVPPRVNINVGTGTSSKTKKRRRAEDEEDEEDVPHMEEMEVGEGADSDDAEAVADNQETAEDVKKGPRQSQKKQRRIETLGQRKVGKEVYKKGKERKKMEKSAQWSR